MTADNKLPIPPRVLIIAGAFGAFLLVLVVLVSGLGTPTQPTATLDPNAPNDDGTLDPGTASGGSNPAEAGEMPAELDDPEPAEGTTTTPDTVTRPNPTLTFDPSVPTEPVTLQLYFVDERRRRLTPELRDVRAPRSLATRAEIALHELLQPGVRSVLSPLPAGTTIREVWVSPGGIAYVDFGTEIVETLPQGSMAELHAVYGIVATLTGSFPDIRLVQILVGGKAIESLTGHMDLSVPIAPMSDWRF